MHAIKEEEKKAAIEECSRHLISSLSEHFSVVVFLLTPGGVARCDAGPDLSEKS